MGFWKSTLSNVIATLIGALLVALAPKFLDLAGLFPSGWALLVEWSQWVWVMLTKPLPVPFYMFLLGVAFLFFSVSRSADLAAKVRDLELKSIRRDLDKTGEEIKGIEQDVRATDLKIQFEKAYALLDPHEKGFPRPGVMTGEHVRLVVLLVTADETAVPVGQLPMLLGSSRAKVRHAVEALEKKGIIEVENRKGLSSLRLTSQGLELAAQAGLLH